MKLEFEINAHDDEAEAAAPGGYLILNSEGFEDTATSGKTALMIAVLAKNERMVGHMLNNGFDPDAQDDLGYTALMYAARVGNIQLCQQLVHGGANLWITNRSNQTALQVAECAGHENVAVFIRDFERAASPSTGEVSLLNETLADGYVIAVRTKSHGILPVIAVTAENTEIMVVGRNGDEISVKIVDCEEELTINSGEFEANFSPAQVKRLAAA